MIISQLYDPSFKSTLSFMARNLLKGKK